MLDTFVAGAARYAFAISDVRPHGWGFLAVVRYDNHEGSHYGLIYPTLDGRWFLYARDGAGWLSVPIAKGL